MKAFILAAGKGTRMRSELPKVLHKVDGVPMILKTIENLLQVIPEDKIVVVIGHSLPRSLVVGSSIYTSEGHIVVGKRTGGQWNLFGGTVSPNEMGIAYETPTPLTKMLDIELEEELGFENSMYTSTPMLLQTMMGYYNRVEINYSTQLNISNAQLINLFQRKGNKEEHVEIQCLTEAQFKGLIHTQPENINPSLMSVTDIVFS